jgi:hypothetical protein
MNIQHYYEEDCAREDCLRITFAARFGQSVEHEITSSGQQIGNVSTEHEVIGNPQSPTPRSSGYGA